MFQRSARKRKYLTKPSQLVCNPGTPQTAPELRLIAGDNRFANRLLTALRTGLHNRDIQSPV